MALTKPPLRWWTDTGAWTRSPIVAKVGTRMAIVTSGTTAMVVSALPRTPSLPTASASTRSTAGRRWQEKLTVAVPVPGAVRRPRCQYTVSVSTGSVKVRGGARWANS